MAMGDGLTKPHLYDPSRYWLHHRVELYTNEHCGRCPALKRGSCWEAFWQILDCMATKLAPSGSQDHLNLYATYKEVYKSEEESLIWGRQVRSAEARIVITKDLDWRSKRKGDKDAATPDDPGDGDWEYDPL